MQKQSILLGFTLVELIVVITIVGILSTVGFVSYSGYLTGARDSNRISQMVRLSDSLQVYSANKTLPLPDDNIQITASGTLIAYQGDVGVDVLETIDYTNGGTDPKDGDYYTYYLTRDRTSVQLMALMEEGVSVGFNTFNQANANFEDRFPKVYGRKLGVLTYNDESDTTLTNTPANLISTNAGGLDIVSTPTAYIAHIADDEKLEGTGSTLQASNPNGSCKRLKQTGGGGDNGVYTISPVGTDFDVYCEMETAGGGWTLIARSVEGGTGNFGWEQNLGNINNDSIAYSMGSNYRNISFESILYSGYSTRKNIDLFLYKFNVTIEDIIGSNTSGQTYDCSTFEELDGNNCTRFSILGNQQFVTTYQFSDNASFGRGLQADGTFQGAGGGMLNDLQGMIFIK